MEPEILLHDVIQLLHAKKAFKEEDQEAVIKRYMENSKVIELEQIMKKYKTDYSCDFKALHARVIADVNADLFHIV